MKSSIPEAVVSVYEKIEAKGLEVFLVGGSVRDLLLKRKVKDWDLTTNGKPEDITKIFPESFYNNNFGTVGIPINIEKEKRVIEITTYRTEKSTTPTHKPEEISWGKTLEEDLARRDFTINAIAMKSNGEIIDPFGGEKDLKQKLLKTVGSPNLRFKEDALRLLRAVRIATELNFKIENNTWEKIKEDAKLIENISKERITTELLRILSSENAYEGILLLKDSNLLEYIVPELLEGIGISQARPGRHHTEDVFTHNIMSLKFCPSKDPIVKFATLLHDIGKPSVAKKDQDGFVIFHNHEVAGAKIAEKICERLKFSNKDKDKIVTLIRWHMFSVNENQTDSAARRFIRRIGVENVKDMMDLRVGDRLGGGTQKAESWRLKLFKEKIEKELKPAPFSVNDLAVDGKDVMKILKIKPGPKVGEILNLIFKEVDEDLSKNKKEYLKKRIEDLGK